MSPRGDVAGIPWKGTLGLPGGVDGLPGAPGGLHRAPDLGVAPTVGVDLATVCRDPAVGETAPLSQAVVPGKGRKES